jgi:hypothetical protein
MTDTAMVPYDQPSAAKKPAPFWFEWHASTFEAFNKAMRSYRHLMEDQTKLFIVTKTKETDDVCILQSQIFDLLPKGLHEFPERSKPAWMEWSLSGVRAHACVPQMIDILLQIKRKVSVIHSLMRAMFLKQLANAHKISCDLETLQQHFGTDSTPPRAKPSTRFVGLSKLFPLSPAFCAVLLPERLMTLARQS